ncbi:hypothetical protein Pla108_22650 [Botrimarina colliarenosi]|uniref:DUF4328 domain-containing protein n=1 Tax=Botrimarina colliarenosi TaxID=2528001 RepID=A0A5C6AFM3_9BACT|nr:DUF4328 domain-containing protein [Botrimarina colliarenosi]TWT98108.1 hypothetical protein Pla108_22650 [Botrimarina colliarenosi]
MAIDDPNSQPIFRSAEVLSRVVVIGLLTFSLLQLTMIGIATTVLVAVSSDAVDASHDLLEKLEGVESFGLIAGIASFIFTATVYSKWKYRSYRNLEALGVSDLRYTPAWAVGSYFVPILNLVRPFRAMNDIWNGTLNQPLPRNAPLVSWWWAAWLLGNVLHRASNGFLRGAVTVSSVQVGLGVGLAGGVVMIASAILLVKVVRFVTVRQIERQEMASLG